MYVYMYMSGGEKEWVCILGEIFLLCSIKFYNEFTLQTWGKSCL